MADHGIRTPNLPNAALVEVLGHYDAGGGQRALGRSSLAALVDALRGIIGTDPTGITALREDLTTLSNLVGDQPADIAKAIADGDAAVLAGLTSALDDVNDNLSSLNNLSNKEIVDRIKGDADIVEQFTDITNALAGTLNGLVENVGRLNDLSNQEIVARTKGDDDERKAREAAIKALTKTVTDQVTMLDVALKALQTRVGQTAAASDLAALRRVVDTLSSNAAVTALARTVAGKVDAADIAPIADAASAAVRAALSADASAPPSAERPGDGARAFTFASTLTRLGGEPGALPPLPASLIASSAAGGVVRLIGAGILAAREAEPIERGRIREIRATLRRRADASDPNNDTVRVGLLWLDQTKTPLPGNPYTVVADLSTLTAATGRRTVEAYASGSAGEGVTIVAPAGAVYYRRFVHNFGADGVTDVETLSGSDATGTAIPPAVTTDALNRLAQQESINAGPRIDRLESAVQNPNSLTFATQSDAQAATVPANVTTILLRGHVDAGDGAGGLYSRVPGPARPEDFATRDGAIWRHTEDAGAVAYRVDPADPTAVQRRVSEDLRDRPTHINLFTPITRANDDDTPYYLAQARHKSRLGGGVIDLPRQIVLRTPGSIPLFRNVTVRCGIGVPGMAGNNYTLGGYGSLNGIALDAASKLVPMAGSSTERALIYRRGMTFPEISEADFAGTCFEASNSVGPGAEDDISIDRVMALGFAKILYSDGNARLTIDRLLMDGKSGLDIRNSFDIARVTRCQAFPYVSLPAAANGMAGADLTRSGIGYNFEQTNDGTMQSHCLALGYVKNYRYANLNSLTSLNNWSDGTREKPGTFGFSTEGACTDVHHIGNQSAGQQIGFYQDTVGGVITHYDGCQAWLNTGAYDPARPSSAFDGHNFLIQAGDFNIQGGVSRDNGFGITVVSPAATGTIEMAFRNILNTPINNFGRSPYVVVGDCDYGNFGYDYSSGSAVIQGKTPVLGAASILLASGGVLRLPATGRRFVVFGSETISLIAGMYPGREVTLTFTGAPKVAMGKGVDAVWVEGEYDPRVPFRQMSEGSILRLEGGEIYHAGLTLAPIVTL